MKSRVFVQLFLQWNTKVWSHASDIYKIEKGIIDMADKKKRKRLTIDSSVTYRINVQGCLDEIWSDRLAGMQITITIQVYSDPITTLVGQLKDQSELIGVLNGLYELRMPLLSLEVLSEKKDPLGGGMPGRTSAWDKSAID